MMQTYKTEDNIHKAWLYRVLLGIADDSYLSETLYFKGGTCASMLGWLDRFSVDLDFDYGGEISDIQKTRDALEKVFKDLGLAVKDSSKNGIQYFLKYDHDGRNTLKLDVTFPLYTSSVYKPERFLDIDRIIVCQTKETMFSHKLCALTDRFTKTGHIAGRDLYDLHYFFMAGFEFDPSIIIERTGLSLQDFFRQTIQFIEEKVTDRIITEDLSPLVSPQKFKLMRRHLKMELLQFLRNQC